MDFRFTPEEEAFRKEVQDFLEKEMPPGWDSIGMEDEFGIDENWAVCRQMAKKLAAKGWLAMAWPKEYGGQARSYIEQAIFIEEMALRGAPGVDTFGVRMVGPTLIRFGTEEQKKQHLGGIARGEVVWSEGFSEPEAGSDLASLQARAVEDGNDFIINGQKVWTSGAHRSDWIFFLVRTDPQAPKHRGISFLLADIKTPGIEVRPLINILGGHAFNEVYFDDARVPKENVVGEKNKGWYVAAALLDFERSGVQRAASAKLTFNELLKYVNETKRNDKPLIEDPEVREILAEMAIETQIEWLCSWHGQLYLSEREKLGSQPYNLYAFYKKTYLTNHAEQMDKALGMYGQLKKLSKYAPFDGRAEAWWQDARSFHPEGTIEILKVVVAGRGLGLPRAPRPEPTKKSE